MLKKEINSGVSTLINRIDSRSFLEIGTECVEIADYSIKSSADGLTELFIIIKGNTNEFITFPEDTKELLIRENIWGRCFLFGNIPGWYHIAADPDC